MQIEALALLAHAIGINHGRLHRTVHGWVREPALDCPVDAAPAHRPAHDRLRHQHAAGDGDGCGGGPEEERCAEEGLELEGGGGGEEGDEGDEEGKEGGEVHFGWIGCFEGKGGEGRNFIAVLFFGRYGVDTVTAITAFCMCGWADFGNFDYHVPDRSASGLSVSSQRLPD